AAQGLVAGGPHGQMGAEDAQQQGGGAQAAACQDEDLQGEQAGEQAEPVARRMQGQASKGRRRRAGRGGRDELLAYDFPWAAWGVRARRSEAPRRAGGSRPLAGG